MKNIIKLLTISLALLVFTGCDEEFEGATFDGDGTFVSFLPDNPSSVSVSIDDATASVDLSISASSISDSDRTFPLVLNTDNTTADDSIFMLPASVTIPAGSYFGTFTLQLINNDELNETPRNIVFGLEEGNFSIDNNAASVTVFEVCPVPADFMVGEYDVAEIMSTSASFNGTVAFASGTVTISAPTETTRFFEIPMWPAFRPEARPVTFTLICNTLIMEETGPDNIACTAGVPTIYVDSGNNTYNTADDSFFTITYLEDFDGTCGGPFDSSFSLTKL